VNHGKYLEDLHPRMSIMHYLTRNVTESDNVFFTCLTLNPAPIHLNHEWSKENADELSSGVKLSNASSAVGRPLFNSMFTLALLVGMSVLECMHGRTVANLGFSEVSFPKPGRNGGVGSKGEQESTQSGNCHVLSRPLQPEGGGGVQGNQAGIDEKENLGGCDVFYGAFVHSSIC
jgi:acyl dehydratase